MEKLKRSKRANSRTAHGELWSAGCDKTSVRRWLHLPFHFDSTAIRPRYTTIRRPTSRP